MAQRAHRTECLVTREWHYLKGLGAVLLEKVCHFMDFKSPSQALWLSLFLLPVDPSVELSANSQHHVCMHAAILPTMVTMD